MTNSMLFDFHARENSKKPGSVHATYLVSGVQSKKAILNSSVAEINEDVHMQSSPFMGSSAPRQDVEKEPSTVKVMTLVQEQHLHGKSKASTYLTQGTTLLIKSFSCQRAVRYNIFGPCL